MSKMNSAALPTYIRVKSNDCTKLVVRYDDGHIEFDTGLMFKISSMALESEADNLAEALEEMKTIVYEKYGRVKISKGLIEAMEEFFVEKNIPKRLDYTEPRHWTTGRLPSHIQKEYEEGRKEEMQQLRRDAWPTFKK